MAERNYDVLWPGMLKADHSIRRIGSKADHQTQSRFNRKLSRKAREAVTYLEPEPLPKGLDDTDYEKCLDGPPAWSSRLALGKDAMAPEPPPRPSLARDAAGQSAPEPPPRRSFTPLQSPHTSEPSSPHEHNPFLNERYAGENALDGLERGLDLADGGQTGEYDNLTPLGPPPRRRSESSTQATAARQSGDSATSGLRLPGFETSSYPASKGVAMGAGNVGTLRTAAGGVQFQPRPSLPQQPLRVSQDVRRMSQGEATLVPNDLYRQQVLTSSGAPSTGRRQSAGSRDYLPRTVADVATLLRSMNLGQYVEAFEQEQVSCYSFSLLL